MAITLTDGYPFALRDNAGDADNIGILFSPQQISGDRSLLGNADNVSVLIQFNTCTGDYQKSAIKAKAVTGAAPSKKQTIILGGKKYKVTDAEKFQIEADLAQKALLDQKNREARTAQEAMVAVEIQAEQAALAEFEQKRQAEIASIAKANQRKREEEELLLLL